MKVAERKWPFDSIRVIHQIHAEAPVVDAAPEHHAVRRYRDYAAASLHYAGESGGRHITLFQQHFFVHVMKEKLRSLNHKQCANKCASSREDEGSSFQLGAEQQYDAENETE